MALIGGRERLFTYPPRPIADIGIGKVSSYAKGPLFLRRREYFARAKLLLFYFVFIFLPRVKPRFSRGGKFFFPRKIMPENFLDNRDEVGKSSVNIPNFPSPLSTA